MKERVKEAVVEAGPGAEQLLTLADKMPSYLGLSRSDNTYAKYNCYYQKWVKFITNKGGKSLPASDIHVALYIIEMLENKCSHNVISTTYYAIKWFHELHGYKYEAGPYVSNLIQTAKRMPKTQVVRKDPISPEMLIELCKSLEHNNDLAVTRDLSIMLSYAGFLRYDEVSNIKFSDVVFEDTHLSIKIRKSKTDQFRDGNTVLVAKGTTIACPVSMLKKYLTQANINWTKEQFLFRPLHRSKGTCKLITKNKNLSYSRARECILARLKGLESTKGANIGLHSFRAGGATQAANSNVKDRCWKRHGRWATDSAKDRYVRDSVESRLEVTRHMGI
jgi:integrase